MDQQRAWDAEYTSQKLLSPSNVPQGDVVRFLRWLKKEHKKAQRAAGEEDAEPLDMEQMRVLDLGSGTGRNAYYFAEQGARVMGLEFSPTALEMAKKIARHGEVAIEYHLQSIAEKYPTPDRSIDIALDVTSSNSLSDRERETYLRELSRVLKPNGYVFLRALSFEGDAHAKELVKRFPGPDPDTYIHPDLGIVEKVFSRESLQAAYGPYFEFVNLERIQHYATVAGRKYKRSYWIAYLRKPED